MVPGSIHCTSDALRVQVQGVVQGVGFRPFVYRLAHRHNLQGWVLNAEDGVEIHVEGASEHLAAFVNALKPHSPPAARIAQLNTDAVDAQGFDDFSIRESARRERPTVRISPDLPVCADCLKELFTPSDRRYRYAYINCTNCGPRYSIIEGLPYDRLQTTMNNWSLCGACAREYEDPLDRRFHAQPVACPACGPHYYLHAEGQHVASEEEAIERAARMLRDGRIVAVKGIGGYHLACDARNTSAVRRLRRRKYRKEKPFALMVADVEEARRLVDLSEEAEALLTSTPRPIVLAPSATALPGVAPDNRDLGIMLPYTPVHHLLFDRAAPSVLVMTSANRSSEPITYRDDDAIERLTGIADAFLMGDRPIARRVDDSVARVGPFGPVCLRRARGYAPRAVTELPTTRPLLAVGPDLKNTVTLVVEGQAFVSQHIGDLTHYSAFEAFQETIRDLLEMYEIASDDLLVVHDWHPQYAATRHVQALPGTAVAVQHHQAHIASVLAEHKAWTKNVIGFSFDGTGYGDDGHIWGGEVFAGGLTDGFQRIAHLRPGVLPGGDAAARVPVQAAAGFLDQVDGVPDLTAPPFNFPDRYLHACQLVEKDVRCLPTTSMGRLFDTVAALLGFTRDMTFEGQAAIWLEHQARSSSSVAPYPFPELDVRPLLQAVIEDRLRDRAVAEIARAFHEALAREIFQMGQRYCATRGADTIVLSGGVFQNQLLLQQIKTRMDADGNGLSVWVNRAVPPNDGGISLGQAALGVLQATD